MDSKKRVSWSVMEIETLLRHVINDHELYMVVPDLAAEEIVTVDSDNSNDSEELSVHTVPSVESDMFSGHNNSDSSSDVASTNTLGDMLGGDDSSSTSPVLLENIDSADDPSVVITDDEDSNGMRRSISNESIDSMSSELNEGPAADETAPSVESHNLNVMEPQDTSVEPSFVAAATSSASVPIAMEYVTVHSTDLQNGPESSNVLPVNLDSSIDCFAVSKPKRLPKAPAESPAKSDVHAEIGEDGESCPICFEPWTNSGVHRLASLRCGHLFGQSCIEKWLKGQIGKCPQCNAKANRKDVRVLFARALKTVDTTERDRALEELEKEKEARRIAELEAAKARMHHQMALNECHQLRQELERKRQQVEMLRKFSSEGCSSGLDAGSQFSNTQTSGRCNFTFEKHIKVNEVGGCRVLSYCSQMATLCISQQSSNTLFPGFGVKKVSAIDFKTTEFVWVHSKAIRDLSFNVRASDATLLSCSIDKSIKLTSLHSNKIIQTYECQYPVWSCAWDANERNCFYAGLQNGSVYAFDVRNLSEPTLQLNLDASSRSPVVSLQYVPSSSGNSPRPGGLLVGQLDRSTFHEKRPAGDYKVHLLPLETNLTSLSFEESTSHILASYRPSARCPNVRHQVCELAVQSSFDADTNSVSTDCTCRSLQTFYGGATQKLLARSRIISSPGGNELLACSGDEASLSLYVWNAGTGQLQQKMPTADPVIDVCPISVNGDSFVAALTEKLVNVYRLK